MHIFTRQGTSTNVLIYEQWCKKHTLLARNDGVKLPMAADSRGTTVLHICKCTCQMLMEIKKNKKPSLFFPNQAAEAL